MSRYETYKTAFQGCPLPFAYVDLDLLDTNIRQIIARAGGKRIRVASKSIRSLPILQRILAADPAFGGVLCFTAPSIRKDCSSTAIYGYCSRSPRPPEQRGWVLGQEFGPPTEGTALKRKTSRNDHHD